MSIATAIEAAQQKVANAYSAVSNKGGTLPATQNLSNLPTAINSIPTGGPSPVIASLTITPTTSQQTITAPTGTDGYSPITVNAVTSSIDANITAGNIKDGVSILGVTGNYSGSSSTKYGATVDALFGDITNGQLNKPSGQFNLDFTGVVTVKEYALAFRFYRMPAIKSISFPNLTTIEASGLSNFCYGEGGVNYPLTSFSANNLTTINNSGLSSAFNNNTNLTGSIDFSKVTSIGSSGLSSSFFNTGITSIDLSSFVSANGSNSLYEAFSSCKQLVSFNLSSLETVSATYALYNCFANCINLTSISLPKLKSITGSSCCSSIFAISANQNNYVTSVSFPKLDTITGSGCLAAAFSRRTALTSLSFPALTSNSFGSYTNQFNNMLSGVTGCTVHFPSNLQSVLSSWASVTAGFGGTNTTIMFDLPATS